MVKHFSFWCLYFPQLSKVGDLLNLFRSLDLSIIPFLSCLVTKLLLLYHSFFFYKERIYSKWIEYILRNASKDKSININILIDITSSINLIKVSGFPVAKGFLKDEYTILWWSGSTKPFFHFWAESAPNGPYVRFLDFLKNFVISFS